MRYTRAAVNLSPRSLPAVRARLVLLATQALGREPTDASLRCLPLRKAGRDDDGAIVEWRASFEVGARAWVATGRDRDAALKALELRVEAETRAKAS